MEAYPEVLKETPRPLVAILGPKEIQGRILPVLRSINEEFIPQINLISFGYEPRYMFPLKKEKQIGTSTPRGILKSTWLQKHHEILPSVLVLFYAFEPRLATRDWAIQETVIRDEVDDLKRNVSGRDCKILLVLVQLLDDGPATSHATSSMVNHSNSDERIQSLRKRAELDTKSIWLLKETSRTNATMIKLEAAIRSNAIEYYKTQAKRVKKYKKPHKILAVRHSFKIAHYYEFRKYTTKMFLHYEAAYKAILQLPMADADSVLQIKAVAEYIHFKLVFYAIFISHNLKAAVDQLQRHMKAFSRAVGASDRSYQHWAWVSRQYQVFGQLVMQSQSLGLVNGGLDSDLYKEAYLYFSAAAKYATWRRKAAAKMNVQYDPNAIPPLHSSCIYIGNEIENPEAYERTIPHAAISIALLSQAYEQVQFHLNHRYRLKHRLILRLGIEHVANCEYATARTELEKSKAAYIQERWYGQVSQVLRQLLVCVQHQNDSNALMDYSLQLLSPKLDFFVRDRLQIQENLFNTFQQLEQPHTLPEMNLDALKHVVSVYVDFKESKAFVRETIPITVTIESYLAAPIQLKSILLIFTPDGYNQTIEKQDMLMLLPYKPVEIQLEILLQSSPGKLQCQQVRFLFENNHGVQWIWSVSTFQPMPLLLRKNSLLLEMEGVIPGMGRGAGSPSFQRKPANSIDFDDIELESLGGELLIVQPKAHATVDLLCSQVLVGDLTPLRFVLHSNQDTIISPQYTIHTQDIGSVSRLDGVALESSPSSEENFIVWFQCIHAKDIALQFHLTYETSLGVQVSMESTFTVHVVPPFTLDTSLHWSYPNQQARLNQIFSLVGRLTSSATIEIQSIQLDDMTVNASIESQHGVGALKEELGAGDQHSLHIRLKPHTVMEKHSLGKLKISWWKPEPDKPEDSVETTLLLPAIPFLSVPLTVDLKVPPFGMEGMLTTCVLTLKNHTMQLMAVQVKIAPESDFLLCGLVDGRIELLPLETLTTDFGLVPMHPGHLKLPKLELIHCDSKESYLAPDERLVLYVVPHGHVTTP